MSNFTSHFGIVGHDRNSNCYVPDVTVVWFLPVLITLGSLGFTATVTPSLAA
jgi:hypothetical protein